MKLTTRGSIVMTVGLIFACGAPAHVVMAQNPMSPTMRQAALLKDFPPPGWIRHYLPEDRYKIVGNVWHVVSTQDDTFYHRPDCPSMLRQSADNVLGFASVQDALDAGYLPDPQCNPNASSALHFGVGGGQAAASKAERVTLSDGASSVILPAGWSRLPMGLQSMMGNSMSMDMLRPANGSGGVSVVTMILPGVMSAEQFLEPARAEQTFGNLAQMMSARAATDSNAARAQDMLQSMRFRPATLAGLHGLAVTMKSYYFTPGESGTSHGIMVGRGQKIYIINTAGSPAGASEITNSFHPR